MDGAASLNSSNRNISNNTGDNDNDDIEDHDIQNNSHNNNNNNNTNNSDILCFNLFIEFKQTSHFASRDCIQCHHQNCHSNRVRVIIIICIYYTSNNWTARNH